MSWTRSFATSQRTTSGTFGHGWTSSFDIRLSPATGASLADAPLVRLKQENGSELVFTADENGGFTAPFRVFATLKRLEDGSFELVRRQRQIFVFSPDGRLTSQRDLNGNTISLGYDGDRLATVSDESGRAFSLTWAAGLVSTVEDSSGRMVSYDYSETGDLLSVTRPDGSVKAYTYDSLHRVTSLIHEDGGATTNVYDSSHRVTKQIDPLGRATTFAYAAGKTTVTTPDGSATLEEYSDGQVTAETKAFGTPLAQKTTFTYGPTNQVDTTTDALGRVSSFAYDAVGNRIAVTDPAGRQTFMSYDELGNLVSATDATGAVVTFDYDDHGNLLSSTDAEGAVTTFEVDDRGLRTTATDPLVRTTSMSYDVHGMPAAFTTPDGATVLLEHDALGRLVTSTDPLGAPTTTAYDALGRVLASTDPAGATTTASYDPAGRLVVVTDALGRQSSSTYDAAGQLTSSADPAGGVTTYSYDPAGRVATVTDPLGAVTTTAYDALGRVTTVTDALGGVTAVEYDLGNRVTASTSPSGARTTYTYDTVDQLLTVTAPSGGVTTSGYDLAGRVTSFTDADGRGVSTTYDATGRVLSALRADQSTTAWEYDVAGQLTAYVDGAGTKTSYSYDAAGHQASKTDTAGRTTTYGHDLAGRLITVGTPDGQQIANAYDALSRLTGVTYSDGTPALGFTYDALGARTSMSDVTGTTTYTYDDAHRLALVASPVATVGYGWDAVDQVTSVAYPNGSTVERAYDALGRLTSVTDWAGRTFGFAYTADSRTSQISYPNGTTTVRDTDASGQTVGITVVDQPGQELLTLAYAYSDAGLLADQTTSRAGGQRSPSTVDSTTSSYTWDPLARLASITGHLEGPLAYQPAGQVATTPDGANLTYDAAGQLTSKTSSPDPLSLTSSVTTFEYDARGNRTTSHDEAGSRQHRYNLADQLVQVLDEDDDSHEYTYTADGLRSSTSTTTLEGSSVETFVWDALPAVPTLLQDAGHDYIYGPDDSPVAQIDRETGAVQYLHGDLVGSVRTVTDAAGAVIAESDYTAYGQPISTSSDVDDSGLAALGDVTSFGYAGEYTDATGYIYLRARYYDPTTAQFLTRDPLEDTTRSAYGYTNGNPLQYVDPLGLWGWKPWEWTKDEWSTIGNVTGAVALGVSFVAVTVASGGAAAPLLVAASTALTATSVGSSAIGAIMECADGGPWGACAEKVAVTALSGVGARAATYLTNTAWRAGHVVGQLPRRWGWMAGNSIGPLYDSAKAVYCG